MPEGEIKEEAIKVHGITYNRLCGAHAQKFSKGKCQILINFLNTNPELPIVCHNVQFDRDKVLKRAFKKVGMANKMPNDDRWRCTMEISERCEGLICKSLDGLLSYFNYDERDPDEFHCPLKDSECTAKIYMNLINMPPKKKVEGGFVDK